MLFDNINLLSFFWQLGQIMMTGVFVNTTYTNEAQGEVPSLKGDMCAGAVECFGANQNDCPGIWVRICSQTKRSPQKSPRGG